MRPAVLIVSIFIIFVNINYYIDAVTLTREDIMIGQVFPPEISATVSEDIYLKLIQPLRGQTKCTYRPPGGADDIPVNANLKDAGGKITKWNDVICGIRIRNVTLEQAGGWRLTSSNESNIVRGLAWLIVKNVISPQKISIDALEKILSPTDTKYCYVLRPTQQRSEFPQHAKCDFPEMMEEIDANGIWNVVTGIEGQTEEIIYEVNVEAKVEELVASVEYNKTMSQLVMTCSLVNSRKLLEFCRFVRILDDVGFNMEEGQGSNKYSYYGKGFMKGQCGILITNPADNDRSTWKCYLGVQELGKRQTIGAIVDASDVPQDFTKELETEDVYGINGTSVNLLCKNKLAADYCWFQHPSGRRISVSEDIVKDESDEFRYFGTGVNLGECGITIIVADMIDTGIWSCHMGTTGAATVEASKEINVRISESHLVASSLFQEVTEGDPLVIDCTSIPTHIPINYCRFVLPDGTGFSITEATTSHNALMDNYYFSPNRKMDHGHCSLIVKKATLQHMGQWTCAGRLTGRSVEYIDDFRVQVLENGLSVAAIGGMVFVALFIVAAVFAIGFLTYKKRYQSVARSSITSQTGVPLETIVSPVIRQDDNERNWPRIGVSNVIESQENNVTPPESPN